MDKSRYEIRLDELGGLLRRRRDAVERGRALIDAVTSRYRWRGLGGVAQDLNDSGHTTPRGGQWGRMQVRELLTIGDRFTIRPRNLIRMTEDVRHVEDMRGRGSTGYQMLAETIVERFAKLKSGYDENASDARLLQVELRLACHYDGQYERSPDEGDWESDI